MHVTWRLKAEDGPRRYANCHSIRPELMQQRPAIPGELPSKCDSSMSVVHLGLYTHLYSNIQPHLVAMTAAVET